MGKVSNVVDISQDEFQLVEKEVFELVVFCPTGSVRIQTNKSSYFFANMYFMAAVELSRLLNGIPTKHLTYGIDDNRITEPQTRNDRLCVDYELIKEIITADKLTSNWHPSVVDFFTMFIEIHSSKNS